MPQRKRIAVLDLETDPFLEGRVPTPFLSGFYDGKTFKTIWRDDGRCIEDTAQWLENLPDSYVIYVHNGGRFDFWYFMGYLKADLKIVQSRIIQAFLGKHELRDSYAIMPFALREYNKIEIDMSLLERGRRNAHRDEIIEYLRGDCVYLYDLVKAYWSEFGNVLTIGSAAMKQMKKFCPIKCGNEEYDKKLRRKFFYGGRVQVFRPGIIHERMSVYDVNSMYPWTMSNFRHPIGTGHTTSRKIERDTCFIVATCRQLDGGVKPFVVRGFSQLNFEVKKATFGISIHEWRAAEEFNAFRCLKVHRTFAWRTQGSFGGFIDHFYKLRIEAKNCGDKIHELFYKYLLNSSYGKFAQNSRNYFDWRITDMEPMMEPWEPVGLFLNRYILWRKPLAEFRYYNIATAASITGAARATLYRGLRSVPGLAYCDTDSLIASGPGRLPIDSERLGAWKCEATAEHTAIAGRKLYALTDGAGAPVKVACAGSRISHQEIFRIARDGDAVVEYTNRAPTFRLDGSMPFLTKRVRRTV